MITIIYLDNSQTLLFFLIIFIFCKTKITITTLAFRFFISIGVTAEVCHVDPTGSVHSGGASGAAKRKLLTSPAKKSPQKTPIKKTPQRSYVKKKPQNSPVHSKSPNSSMKGKPLKNKSIDSKDLCSDEKVSKLKKRRLAKKMN